MKKKPSMIAAARILRGRQTESEKILWSVLRNRQLDGYKFNRQHPIVFDHDQDKWMHFIVDFYCAEAKLIIELDGGIHDTQQEADKNRDRILNELGYLVLRFKNESLLEIEKVLTEISKTITLRVNK